MPNQLLSNWNRTRITALQFYASANQCSFHVHISFFLDSYKVTVTFDHWNVIPSSLSPSDNWSKIEEIPSSLSQSERFYQIWRHFLKLILRYHVQEIHEDTSWGRRDLDLWHWATKMKSKFKWMFVSNAKEFPQGVPEISALQGKNQLCEATVITTFDHKIIFRSSLNPRECLYKNGYNSLKAFFRYRVHWNGTDRQPENIMPPAIKISVEQKQTGTCDQLFMSRLSTV